MRAEDPRPIYLKDYRPSDYLIEEVTLDVALEADATRVHSTLHLMRNRAAGEGPAPLVLDGEKMTLHEVRLNGEVLSPNKYAVDDEHLTVFDVPSEPFTLETVTTCSPKDNTALSGLYLSGGIYCTQCEAEGFRRITYYLDRPDVMATFRTRIVADKAEAPVLLSNGNLEASGDLEGGRHFAEWHDPFRKPAYLFALVAGDLAHVSDTFTTMSGREVDLRIYVEPGKEDRCAYAMDALKRSMRWDEERFGREYDLDIFMIVAVSTFNMGAMENKGLNVFNDRYILARPDTATDQDYGGIEGVIAHEYFHNWTGNRITCRDWFQLCLKEGLTVFRDQEFTSDMRSRAVKRISDVRTLRSFQFPEDQGPLAHPVRPDHYIEINNFYTATVYEKGAENCRMIYTLAGQDGFRTGMDLYFERHDGEAATVEDFLSSLADGAGLDLTQFHRWYRQAGTPRLSARGSYDAGARTYTLALAQTTPPTPGQPVKEPLDMPVAVGLVGADGTDLPLTLKDGSIAGATTAVLRLTEPEQSFVFTDVPEKPVPSVLRGFSAPVVLDDGLSEDERIFLMTHDSDPFNQWDHVQRHALDVIIAAVNAGAPEEVDAAGLIACFGELLDKRDKDDDFIAQIFWLPSEQAVAQAIGENVDVEAIHEARENLRKKIALALKEKLRTAYESCRTDEPYDPGAAAAGRRALKNACLGYYALTGEDGVALAKAQFDAADNMTDTMAALTCLANLDSPDRKNALDSFEATWRDDHLVMDKWFSLQAMSSLPNTLDRVRGLLDHPAFTMRNPNKVRALVGAFAQANPVRFHALDGSGYRFVADKILELDPMNPQLAARMLGAFKSWRQMEPARQSLMKAELERIVATEGLSRDSYEIASKTLAENDG